MYKDVDDYEILYMIGDNSDCYEIILEKYKPLIIKICQKYLISAKKIGYELEDLIQIANFSLCEAVKSYDEYLNIKFYTYVTHCIHNKLKTEIRNQATNKKKSLNTAISYDAPYFNNDVPLIQLLEDENADNPYELIESDDVYIKYRSFINSMPFETAVVCELKLNGFNNEEIKKFVKIDQKSYNKHLEIIRKKMKLHYSNFYYL